MRVLKVTEITAVSGGFCKKTLYSSLSTMFTGIGTALQGFGQVLHSNLGTAVAKAAAGAAPLAAPAAGTPVVTEGVVGNTAQKWTAIGVGAFGFGLNAISIVFSSLSTAEPTCKESGN